MTHNPSEARHQQQSEQSESRVDVLTLPRIDLTEEHFNFLAGITTRNGRKVTDLDINYFKVVFDIEQDQESIIVTVNGQSRVINATVEDFGTTRVEMTNQLLDLMSATTDDVTESAASELHDVVVTPERESHPHLAALFQPMVRPEVPDRGADEYSYLFEDDDVVEAERQRRAVEEGPILRAQREYDKLVSDASRQLAESKLRSTLQRDGALREILDKHGYDRASLDAVDALRTDEDLRYEVGTYLLDKLRRMTSISPMKFGDRILKDGTKRTDARAMPTDGVSSQEYAAFLALAKIDGSFNADKESDSDKTEYGFGGQPIQGQHRAAAEYILDSSIN